MKKLSIIIPVYNSEKYLDRCLNSILIQATSEYEILLLNDGSTDNSIEILNKYQIQYPDIIRVIDKSNEGVAKTRNRGIREALGEFICFVDNDDFVDPDYFETYLDAIRNTSYDLIIGGFRRQSDTSTLFTTAPTNSEWFKFMVIVPWARIYRKSFILENNLQFLDYKMGEDVYFNLSAYAKTKAIKIIDYIGYNWYYNDISISNTDHKGFNPDIHLTEFLDIIYKVGDHSNPYFNYYYVKHLIWYLLYSGRNASSTQFIDEYQKAEKWRLDKQIKLSFPLFSSKLRGERLSVRLIINIFIICTKLHLVPLFARMYCKKRK